MNVSDLGSWRLIREEELKFSRKMVLLRASLWASVCKSSARDNKNPEECCDIADNVLGEFVERFPLGHEVPKDA